MHKMKQYQPNDSQVYQVKMGEGMITRTPHTILSRGLGSCVAITLYDTQRKIGGLAHIMLPDSPNMWNDEQKNTKSLTPLNPPKGVFEESRNSTGLFQNPKSEIRNPKYHYADTAIPALLKVLQSKGALLQNIVAKMVGGACMFSDYGDENPGIGTENIISIKESLRREGIPLMGEDIGGHHGRSVEFHLDSGKIIVKAVGKEDKKI